jgi:hypothetical protein
MKKLFPFLFIVTVLFQACDKIEMPYREPGTAPAGGGGTSTEVDSTVVEETGAVTKVRKVLIEDYTGHKCGNCPAAALKLEEIQTANPNQVVGIAVHAGSFAHVATPNYTTDFATPTGDEWDTFFGISNAGNPNGMVNRKDYPSPQHIKQHNTWSTEVATALAVAPDAWLHIRNTYFKNSRTLKTHVTNEYLTAQNGTYKISAVIVESGIVDYQKDYSQTPADIPNYTFNHLLRASLNGSWGDTLASGAIVVGATQTKDYQFTLPATWKEANCKVVTFIYNAATYEVMQVNEEKVTTP